MTKKKVTKKLKKKVVKKVAKTTKLGNTKEKRFQAKTKKGVVASLSEKKSNSRTKELVKKMVENGGKQSVGKTMIEVGFSEAYAKNPHKIRSTKQFQKFAAGILTDEVLMQHHSALLNSYRIEHAVFPLALDDEEIKELLASVNCTVRKIRHSESQKHAWFWSPDNRARKDALDMAYKVRGRYAAEKLDISKRPLEDLTDEEIVEYEQELIRQLRKK